MEHHEGKKLAVQDYTTLEDKQETRVEEEHRINCASGHHVGSTQDEASFKTFCVYCREQIRYPCMQGSSCQNKALVDEDCEKV